MPCRSAVLLTLAAWASPAHAEAPVAAWRSPRMIGRAGVGTVSDDGAGALLVNPAGLARRGATRLQLATTFVDDELSWIDSASAPVARDQSSSRLLPLVGIEGSIGEYIVGIAVMTAARSERLLRRPGAIPPDAFGNSFEYRYSGLSGGFRRDTLTVGVAHRFSDTVAGGLAFGASRAAVAEERRLWAGDTGRIVLGLPQGDVRGDPTYDAELELAGTAPFVPSAVAGVLVVPADSRLELGFSLGWSAPVRAHGDIAVASIPSNIDVDLSDARARVEVESPITTRAGARWLGERWIAEVGADLWWFPRRARQTAWVLDGVTLVDTTTVGVRRDTALESLPSRISSRTHGAMRAAIDVELIPGFLWATGGYAWARAGTAGARQSPTFGDLGGHTMALGLEGNAGGFTVTLGWARMWSVKSPEPVTHWRLDNPYGTGNGPIPTGTFDGSTDMIGLSIDAELDAP